MMAQNIFGMESEQVRRFQEEQKRSEQRHDQMVGSVAQYFNCEELTAMSKLLKECCERLPYLKAVKGRTPIAKEGWCDDATPIIVILDEAKIKRCEIESED